MSGGAPKPNEDERKKRRLFFPHLDPKLPIYTSRTGFVKESPEVETYLRLLADGLPTAIYEFFQNQWDYNNDALGGPETWLYTKDGKRISYPQFIRMSYAEAEQLMENCVRCDFINHLIPGKGLKQDNITDLYHGGGKGTLGTHGRGGKAAGAAMIAGEFATGFEYYSVGEDGPWHGEAIMGVDEEQSPAHKKPSFTLGYNILDNDDSHRTIVTIHNPNKQLLQTMRILPRYFLPANPNYQCYRYNHSGEIHPIANMMTVYAGPDAKESSSQQAFSFEEQKNFGIPTDVKHREAPRVEIISRELIGKGQVTREDKTVAPAYGVFVDGLAVKTFNRYALDWSFWGFQYAENQSYRAKRGQDSEYMDGEPRSLMAMTLGQCTNPNIFETLLHIASRKEDHEENKISSSLFLQTLKEHPTAAETLKTAWIQFCKTKGIDPNTPITSSSYHESQAKEAHINALHINNEAIVDALQDMKIIKTVEHDVYIPPKAEASGERMRYPRIDEIELTHVMNDILRGMYMSNATLTPDPDNRGITIDLRYGHMSPPVNLHDLPRAIELAIEDLQRYFAYYMATSCNIDDGKSKTTEITQHASVYEKIVAVTTYERELPSSGMPSFQVHLAVNSDYQYGKAEELVNFFSRTAQTFQAISKNGHIDKELFHEYEKTQSDSFESILQKLERQSERRRTELLAETDASIKEAQTLLDNVQAEIQAKLRKLGQIEEDMDTPAPTRASLHPDFVQYDKEKPVTRKYTTLNAANTSPRATNDTRRYPINTTPGPFSALPSQQFETIDGVKRYLQDNLESLRNPDMQLLRPDLLPATERDHLICNVHAGFSGNTQYQKIELPKTKTIASPGIHINKKVVAGTHAVPHPPNCTVVGFYHHDTIVTDDITIEYSPEKGVYTYTSKNDVPQGLEFYFKYDPNTPITSSPSAQEQSPLANPELFHKSWKQLVDLTVAHKPPLDEKQKADIALTAWLHAFKYNKDIDIDKIFEGLPDPERYAEVVNRATGNCGYGAEGLLTIFRAMGLSATTVGGYLGENGRFFPGPQNHGMVGVYINGNFVIVEAQETYLSGNLRRERIPNEFVKIIKRIPTGKNMYPFIERRTTGLGSDAILAQLKERGIVLDAEAIQMLENIQQITESDSAIYQGYSLNEPQVPSLSVPTGQSAANSSKALLTFIGDTREQLKNTPPETLRPLSALDMLKKAASARGIEVADGDTLETIMDKIETSIRYGMESLTQETITADRVKLENRQNLLVKALVGTGMIAGWSLGAFGLIVLHDAGVISALLSNLPNGPELLNIPPAFIQTLRNIKESGIALPPQTLPITTPEIHLDQLHGLSTE